MVTHDRESKFSLVFRVGARFCALPVEQVVETMRPLPIRALPNLPPTVLGLAVVRGEAIPVIDAVRLLVGDAEPATPTRFLTIKLGQRRAVLAVTEVVGVRVLDDAAFGALPPLLGAAHREVVSALGVFESEMFLLLESARMVPDAVWSSVNEARA